MVLLDDVGTQVSLIIYLFFKSHLTTILNYNLSRLPSYWIFALQTFMHGVTGSPISGSTIIKFLLLMKFLISFKIVFKKAFLKYVVNIVTSEISWVLELNVILLSLILLNQNIHSLVHLLQNTGQSMEKEFYMNRLDWVECYT